MSGFFGVASKDDCVLELFYGVDYHSHLEHAAEVWLFTENMDLTVPSTTLRTRLSVQNLTEMWGP